MPLTRKADFYLGCLDSSVFIDFNQTLTGENVAIVKNFPGLFAEMNEVELRAVAHELSIAADTLHNSNRSN